MSPITTTDVDSPAGDVFAYATDPSRFKEWQQSVVDGHLDTPDAVRVGTRCLTTRRIGGAARAAISEVTHVDPPRGWGVRGIDGPIRAIVDVTVEPLTEARSRLTITVDFEGHGIGTVLVPLVVRHQARKECARPRHSSIMSPPSVVSQGRKSRPRGDNGDDGRRG